MPEVIVCIGASEETVAPGLKTIQAQGWQNLVGFFWFLFSCHSQNNIFNLGFSWVLLGHLVLVSFIHFPIRTWNRPQTGFQPLFSAVIGCRESEESLQSTINHVTLMTHPEADPLEVLRGALLVSKCCFPPSSRGFLGALFH